MEDERSDADEGTAEGGHDGSGEGDVGCDDGGGTGRWNWVDSCLELGRGSGLGLHSIEFRWWCCVMCQEFGERWVSKAMASAVGASPTWKVRGFVLPGGSCR